MEPLGRQAAEHKRVGPGWTLRGRKSRALFVLACCCPLEILQAGPARLLRTAPLFNIQYPRKEEKVNNLCKATEMTLITALQNGQSIFTTRLRVKTTTFPSPHSPSEAITFPVSGLVAESTSASSKAPSPVSRLSTTS